ncbi:MAG: glycosyltransferase family 4 protein [Candidatus Bathyarchaeia archaeon]
MNIAIIVNNFHPEIGSAADLFYQLAIEFQKRGHLVNVFTTEPRYYNLGTSLKEKFLLQAGLKGKGKLYNVEQIRPMLNVYRVKLLPLIYPRSGKNAFFRELEHVLQPITFLTMTNHIAKSDIILIYSPPLLLGYLGVILGKLLNIPTVVNVQDIHPDAVVDLGLLKSSFLVSFFEQIERQMYKYAKAITVHSDGNKEIVMKHNINPQKVFVIFNACYIPPDEVLCDGEFFRRRYCLEDKFIVTYAGTMSFSQDLDTIIIAAKILSNSNKEITFILAGDGPQRHNLELLSKKLKVSNILFLPFQGGNDYWRLLSASDVCLVSLKKSKVKTPVVPRKLEDIMASGKPVIANVPLDGDVKKFIEKANCGMVIESENPHSLAEAIQKMYDMPKEVRLQYGRNGRLYAIQNFSTQVIAKQYETLFASLCRL